MSNGSANRAWSAAVEVQAVKRKSSSNKQPVASWCRRLLLESQFSIEVLLRQKLCQDICPFMQAIIFPSESVNYVCVFVFAA